MHLPLCSLAPTPAAPNPCPALRCCSLAPFYRETSQVVFEKFSGAGMAGIGEALGAAPEGAHTVETCDIYPVADASILVLVTGKIQLTGETNALPFAHAMMVAADAAGAPYISNEIFRCVPWPVPVPTLPLRVAAVAVIAAVVVLAPDRYTVTSLDGRTRPFASAPAMQLRPGMSAQCGIGPSFAVAAASLTSPLLHVR